jgi:hypothetical protein
MIKIGETHEVTGIAQVQGGVTAYVDDDDATEAVARLVEAHDDLLAAIADFIDQSATPASFDKAVEDARTALAPFMEDSNG